MSKSKNYPEKKIGPLPGGIQIAIWINEIDTDDGPRKVRSVTVTPRRYKDAESGEWRDAKGYNATDISALIFALTRAQEYIFDNPLEQEKKEAEEAGTF